MDFDVTVAVVNNERITLPVSLDQVESIKERYRRIRRRSMDLCGPLAIEDHSAQPIVDVSPPKWHLGHTTWFFEQFLLKPLGRDRGIIGDAAFFFNSYYEGVGMRVAREKRGTYTRPTVTEVIGYRQSIDHKVEALIGEGLDETQKAILELGLNHEEQHQELLITDIKYILCQEPLFPAYGPFVEGWDQNPLSGELEVKGGIHFIGHEGPGFCFDIERERHKVYLEPFKIHARCVTNREWLEFIADDGYKDHRHWLSEGWQWVKENGITAPLYWYQRDGMWQWFSLQGLVPLDLEMPVAHISYFEASAFANWCGKRSPTEQEWEAASAELSFGQRWEWTQSAFLPYPRYKKAPGAIGEYNGKFMSGQMVLRGASVATAPGHSRPTYRNFFHPHLRWQYTGLRLVEQ